MREYLTPLEEINFLADSVYRSAVLTVLQEGPCTRAELKTVTGASQPTLSRILREFERRNWTVQIDHRYELTPFGTFVAVGFNDLLHRLEIEQKLRNVWREIPAELLELDTEWIVDATITLSSQHNPLAPMDRAAEIGRAATRSRLLTHALPDPCFSAHRHGITTGSHRLEAVVTRGVTRTLAGTSHAPWIEGILPTDRFEMFVTDADVPHVIGIGDDTVYFGVDDERGAPLALIETSDETVFVWAEATFETYRREAVPLTSNEFSHLCNTDESDSQVSLSSELTVER